MRIVYDRVDDGPGYALNKQEAKLVFAELKMLIRKELRHVRFTNKLAVFQGKNSFEQNLFLSIDHLKIASRGLVKEECIHQIVCFFLHWSSYPWLDQRLLRKHPVADRAMLSPQELAIEARKHTDRILIQLSGISK